MEYLHHKHDQINVPIFNYYLTNKFDGIQIYNECYQTISLFMGRQRFDQKVSMSFSRSD